MDNSLNNDSTPEFPIDDGPIPFNADMSDTGLSKKPLNLGSTGEFESQGKPVTPVAKSKPQKELVSADRITRVKTFHTKLTPNAMTFLDEVICEWLANNSGVIIQKVNVVTGVIEAKRHDPSLIISVWY